MSTLRIPDDVIIEGSLKVQGPLPEYPRASLAVDYLQPHPLPVFQWRKTTAFDANLPATSSGTDLGLYTGTHGTSAPYIATSDLKTAGATTRTARTLFQIPANYVAGKGVQIRLAAGMITTVADTSATINVDVRRIARDGTAGANLNAAAAVTINSLTLSDKTITLNAATLAPGDYLDIKATIVVTDAAGVTAVIATIALAEVLCAIQG
jgi:hypothetical protein